MHEPAFWNDEHGVEGTVTLEQGKRLQHTKNRFKTPFYGEVNSTCWWALDDLDVQKGVILRHPMKLWLSEMNRRAGFLKVDFIDRNNPHALEMAKRYDPNKMELFKDQLSKEWAEFVGRIYKVDEYAGKYYTIKFQDMISNRPYVQKICTDFGINDLTVSKKSFKKKENAHSPHKMLFKKPEDLPPQMVDNLRELDWFVKKHELELI